LASTSHPNSENKKKYHKVVLSPLCAVSLLVAGLLIAMSPIMQLQSVAAETQFADFNGDGYADLAIGIPGSTSSGISSDQGSVNVIYGSTSGLLVSVGPGTQVWNRHTPSIEGTTS
jgi:hypothetical protein